MDTTRTANYLQELKEREQQRAGLVNIITDYSIANGMSFKNIEEAIEIVKDLYLASALIKR